MKSDITRSDIMKSEITESVHGIGITESMSRDLI